MTDGADDTPVRKNTMALQLCSKISIPKEEMCFSYCVKKDNGAPLRAGFARVLDISESGLCMEISPFDSDLFVEWCGGQAGFNKEIELQIFCRSHPHNVSVDGSVRWFKQKGELFDSSDRLFLFAGVMFSTNSDDQKRQISELLARFDTGTKPCGKCDASVSIDAAFCYNCGEELMPRSDIVRKVVSGLVVDGKTPGNM